MYKLQYYTSKFKNSFEQGSDDWLEGRKFAFGGSEMATVLNEDPCNSFENLLEKKKNISNVRMDFTEWGKLFEPVAKIFIEEERKTTIYNFSSIPHAYYPVCYSPDGVIVEGDNLVLLEIKCPIQRGVDKIPKQYLHQVKTGMNILNVKYCLFAQFRFRRCSLWADPFNANYDFFYHKEFKKETRQKIPITFGYLYWNIDCELTDLSTKKCMVETLPKKKPVIIIADKNFKPNRGIVLMWKLFDIRYECIEPEKNYLEKNEALLWEQYKQLRNYLN